MHSFTIPAAVAAAVIALLPAASAHGHVQNVVVGGKSYAGASPNWAYASTKPAQAGWYAKNQDNGFVAPSAFGTQDIVCHKSATPGTQQITVAAGSTLELEWDTWPDSHHGPVIDYLARNTGNFASQDPSKLNFFKIAEGGLVDGSASPGKWASDKLLANNVTWSTKIPSGLSGDFVLRHEIIALHSAGNADGAQAYPQCINLKITGSGNVRPCDSGAACKKGTKLYTSTDPGILVNIYQTLSSYAIPGPKIWSGLSKRAMAFEA